MLDLKILGGTIVDGSGDKGYCGDIGIQGERIVSIGNLSGTPAKTEIDATGKIVCPGFIDMHTHSDISLVVNRNASARLYDGVTTDVIGNCGIGLAPVSDEYKEALITYLGTRLVGSIPIDIELPWSSMEDYFDYLDAHQPAVNVAPLLAHGAIRIHEMGFSDATPTEAQMNNMKHEIDKAMKAGCLGMSTGLVYMPGEYSNKDELAELSKTLAPYDGFYVSHIRSEGTNIFEALDEALYIAENGGVPLHVSHLKLLGKNMWGKTDTLFSKFAEANKKGIEITYDAYPYVAGCTSLGACLPPWVFEGGVTELVKRLSDPELREKIIFDMKNGIPGWQNFYNVAGGWDDITIATVNTEGSQKYLGRKIGEIAKSENKDPFTFAFDLMVTEKSRVQIILPGMSLEDMTYILSRPETMVGSDSMSLSTEGVLGTGRPHPRAFGTHAKIIREFVKEKKLLTLEAAVKKMTSLEAARLNLDSRGMLKEGYYADIVVMDLDTVKDNASFEVPKVYSSGFDEVIVNGVLALHEGKETLAYSGRVLRGGK